MLWDTTPSYTWRGAFIYLTWLIHIRVMTHCHTWHDTWRVRRLCRCAFRQKAVERNVSTREILLVTWLIRIFDVTHQKSAAHVGASKRCLFDRRLWNMTLVYTSNMIHARLRSGPFKYTTLRMTCQKSMSARLFGWSCATWPSHVWDITRDVADANTWHDSWRVSGLCRRLFDKRLWDMTHSYVRHNQFTYDAWRVQICDITHGVSVTHVGAI